MNHNQLHCPCGGKIIEDDIYDYNSDDDSYIENWHGHCKKCNRNFKGIHIYEYTETFCEDAVECN